MKSELRKLVEDSPLNLTKIAQDAKVDYYAFRRWFVGEQEHLDADDAEAVFETLTKKKLI